MSERTCILVYIYSPFAFTCHVDDLTSPWWLLSSGKQKIHTIKHLLLLFEKKLYTQFHTSSLAALWNIVVSAYKYVVMKLIDIMDYCWLTLYFEYLL